MILHILLAVRCIGLRSAKCVRYVCFANPRPRRLCQARRLQMKGFRSIWFNRRNAHIPQAQWSLRFATAPSSPFRLIHPPDPFPPLAGAGFLHRSHCLFRQPPSPRFIPPSGSIVALLTFVRTALFRQPPPPRFTRHRRRFGYGATGGALATEPSLHAWKFVPTFSST